MDESANFLTFAKVLGVVILVLANGFFVAAEFSLVAVRRSRIEQLVAEGHPLAVRIQSALDNMNAYLAATQLGTTMASLGLGWLGESVVSSLVEPVFRVVLPRAWAAWGAHSLAAVIAFGAITVLQIIVGELAPKSLALQRSEGSITRVFPVLEVFRAFFRPAIYFLDGLGRAVVRLIGLEPLSREEFVHSVEELKLLVSASREAGLLGKETEQLVERAFEFDDFAARQVMVPRIEMISIESNAPLADALALATQYEHTRLPVFEGNQDNILGVVHLVDIIRAWQSDRETPLRQILRPVLMVPESIHADDLLNQMRDAQAEFAILLDEYGGTEGLVTLYDLVERLVGPVHEGQNNTDTIEPTADGAVVGGRVLIRDLNERFDLTLRDDECDTIGGFVLTRLGRVPAPDDEVEIGNYHLRVETVEGKRIRRLRLTKITDSEPTGPLGL